MSKSLSRPISPIAVYVLLFVVILALRAPQLLLHPRFWAEEATHYYNALQGDQSPFSLIVNGNYQLIVNLVVWLAVSVPAEWAASVTTYFSLAVACFCVYLIGRLAVQEKWPKHVAILVVVAIALCAQGYEVLLSTTNVQWLCAVSLLLIRMLDREHDSEAGKRALYAWVALCALSGVPSAVMTPLFFIKTRFIERSRSDLHFGVILLLGTLVQLAIILTHPHADRQFSPTPLLLTAPLLLQTIVSPLLAADQTFAFIVFLQMNRAYIPLAYAALIGIAVFVVVGAFSSRTRTSVVAMTLLAWLFVPTVYIFGSLGEPLYMISGWMSGRYFFIGVVCFLLLVGMCATAGRAWIRWAGHLLLLMCVCAGLYQTIHLSEWRRQFVHGASWRTQVQACQDTRPCKVGVWPISPTWTFQLQRP
jgi:hypothetical protein